MLNKNKISFFKKISKNPVFSNKVFLFKKKKPGFPKKLSRHKFNKRFHVKHSGFRYSKKHDNSVSEFELKISSHLNSGFVREGWTFVCYITKKIKIVASPRWIPRQIFFIFDPTLKNRHNKTWNSWAFTPWGRHLLSAFIAGSSHFKPQKIADPRVLYWSRRYLTRKLPINGFFEKIWYKVYLCRVSGKYVITPKERWQPRHRHSFWDPTQSNRHNKKYNSWVFTKEGAQDLLKFASKSFGPYSWLAKKCRALLRKQKKGGKTTKKAARNGLIFFSTARLIVSKQKKALIALLPQLNSSFITQRFGTFKSRKFFFSYKLKKPFGFFAKFLGRRLKNSTKGGLERHRRTFLGYLRARVSRRRQVLRARKYEGLLVRKSSRGRLFLLIGKKVEYRSKSRKPQKEVLTHFAKMGLLNHFIAKRKKNKKNKLKIKRRPTAPLAFANPKTPLFIKYSLKFLRSNTSVSLSLYKTARHLKYTNSKDQKDFRRRWRKKSNTHKLVSLFTGFYFPRKKFGRITRDVRNHVKIIYQSSYYALVKYFQRTKPFLFEKTSSLRSVSPNPKTSQDVVLHKEYSQIYASFHKNSGIYTGKHISTARKRNFTNNSIQTGVFLRAIFFGRGRSRPRHIKGVYLNQWRKIRPYELKKEWNRDSVARKRRKNITSRGFFKTRRWSLRRQLFHFSENKRFYALRALSSYGHRVRGMVRHDTLLYTWSTKKDILFFRAGVVEPLLQNNRQHYVLSPKLPFIKFNDRFIKLETKRRADDLRHESAKASSLSKEKFAVFDSLKFKPLVTASLGPTRIKQPKKIKLLSIKTKQDKTNLRLKYARVFKQKSETRPLSRALVAYDSNVVDPWLSMQKKKLSAKKAKKQSIQSNRLNKELLRMRQPYVSKYRGKKYQFVHKLHKESYLSQLSGLRNMHYFLASGDSWTSSMRMHNIKKQQQVLAFKRIFRKQHNQLHRFPRRYNKLALRVYQSLFRAFFTRFLGHKQLDLLRLWARFRRGANRYWTGHGTSNLVRKFSQSLVLAPQNFLLLLKIAETPTTSKAMITLGSVVINGQTKTALGYFIKPGDTIQILPSVFTYTAETIFWHHRFNTLREKANKLKFLQIDWSMLLFTVVYWPKDHEIAAPSFLTERWVRFYVHFFPGKMAHRHKGKIKTVWMKHRPDPAPVTPPKPRKRMKPRPPRPGRTQTRYLYV